jgi:DNA-binding Lrp family transcriptional regulator
MASRGLTNKEVAEEVGVSAPTLSKRMAEIRDKQGLLLKYRSLQALQLTSLQARILEAITPEKINEAPLRDLVIAFKIFKDKELTLDGKPSEIRGLVGYLVNLEKELAAAEQVPDAEYEEMEDIAKSITDPDYTPDLS